MVVLSNADLEALAPQLGVAVKALQTGNITQLKAIIKYLRNEKGARINLTGTKNVLVDGIVRVLLEDNPAKVYPVAPLPQPIRLTSHLPAQQAGHVTIEHNTSWQPQQWVPPKPLHLTFNDENFFAKQVPFYDHVALLAVIPFNAREDMHPKSSFQVDEATLAAVREKKRLVHARFFSKERRGDIPWNIDVALKINGSPVDINKLARKIRSRAYKEPYILPRPADVSHTLRATNTVEFCHPGETGYLVLQVVQERDIDSLISHVVTNCKVTATSRQQMKNDDIEEMNYVLSMKCPLSCMRIENPVRGKLCNHEQCFDLRSFIDYCFQQQLWHCPVCEIGAPYQDLVYDDNFKAISTTTSADKVTVSPDGTITDADGEPTAKRPKLNTPPSAASPPPSVPLSAPLPVQNTNQPPPMVIALVDDSPPPSPVPTIVFPPARADPTPFPFTPPPQVQIPTVTTTTTTVTSAPSSTDVPMLDNPPPSPTDVPMLDNPPSALPIPTQSHIPSEPPISDTNANSVLPPTVIPQSPSPSLTPTQQTQATPPPSHPVNRTSPTNPLVIDLKQEPGLIKKILQKFPNWSPSSTPTSTSTPTYPLPPPSPTTTALPSTSAPNHNTTTTLTTSTTQQNGHGHGINGAYVGKTSTDAIVISDDDD